MGHTRSPLGKFIPIISYFDQMLIDAEDAAEKRQIESEAKAKDKARKTQVLNSRYVESSTIRLEFSDNWCNAYLINDHISFPGWGIERMFRDVPLHKHMLLYWSKKPKKDYIKFNFRFQPIADPVKDLFRNLYFTREAIEVPGSPGWYYTCSGSEQCFGQGYEFMLPIIGLTDKKKKGILYMKLENNTTVGDFL